MKTHQRRALGSFALLLALGACSPGPEAASPSPTGVTASSPSPAIQDIGELEFFAPLEPGTYFIDPDADPSTPLRVVYEVAEEGWDSGAARSSSTVRTGTSR